MIPRLLPALALLFLIGLFGTIGGAGFRFDETIVRSFVGWRDTNPNSTSALILFTQLGGAPLLLGLAVLAAIAVAWRGQRMAALCLLATVIGGRLLIEALKLAVARPRPALDTHPVTVFSQSFPSGHAGNTVITFCAVALFALPERLRRSGLALAIALSLAVGATRPMLGVHWPTDVLAGWCLGALWVTLCWTLWRRLAPAREQQHEVVRGH